MVMVKPLSSDIYLEEFVSILQPSSPKQTAFIPKFSQVSATLPCSKRCPCTTGTWCWDRIDRAKKVHRTQQKYKENGQPKKKRGSNFYSAHAAVSQQSLRIGIKQTKAARVHKARSTCNIEYHQIPCRCCFQHRNEEG